MTTTTSSSSKINTKKIYHGNRPTIPLRGITPLQWKEVKNEQGESSMRLLLINPSLQTAYDGDFGFEFKAITLSKKTIWNNDTDLDEEIYFHEGHFNVYTVRNPHQRLSERCYTHLEYFNPHIDTSIAGLNWFHCSGDPHQTFGFPFRSREVSRIYRKKVKAMDRPFEGEISIDQLNIKEKVVMVIEFTQNYHREALYLNCENYAQELRAKELHTSYYGHVYRGLQYNKIIQRDPSPVPSLHSYHSISSNDSFSIVEENNCEYDYSSDRSNYVIIKTFAFDQSAKKPAGQDVFYPSKLSDLENKTIFPARHRNLNILNEIEINASLTGYCTTQFTSLPTDLSGRHHSGIEESKTDIDSSSSSIHYEDDNDNDDGGYEDKQKKEESEAKTRDFFPKIIDIQVDNFNLFVISHYYSAGSLPFNYINCYSYDKGITTIHKQFIERNAKIFFKKLFEGYSILHQSGICHLDISFENICLDNIPTTTSSSSSSRTGSSALYFTEDDWRKIQPIIIDFGFSRGLAPTDSDEQEMKFQRMPPRTSKNNYGKIYYFCPELHCDDDIPNPFYLRDLPYDPMKIDIWQLGVLMYIALTRRLPFDCQGDSSNLNYKLRHWYTFLSLTDKEGGGLENIPIPFELKEKHMKSFYLMKEVFSPNLLSLLKRMLSLNPNDRPDLSTILNDPWFRE